MRKSIVLIITAVVVTHFVLMLLNGFPDPDHIRIFLAPALVLFVALIVYGLR